MASGARLQSAGDDAKATEPGRRGNAPRLNSGTSAHPPPRPPRQRE